MALITGAHSGMGQVPAFAAEFLIHHRIQKTMSKGTIMQQNTPSSPQILIVGAGAVGLVTGYHLQMAGAKISFLDRPQRFEALSRPQILYSYDDATLRHYSAYAVISQASEAQAQAYDYVIITLDGSTSRSVDGRALLNDLGNAIRDT